MITSSIVHYKGEKYVCTEEPTLKSVDKNGIYAFYGFKKLYICDPKKNQDCKKSGCQTLCKHTFNKEFAKENDDEKA